MKANVAAVAMKETDEEEMQDTFPLVRDPGPIPKAALRTPTGQYGD